MDYLIHIIIIINIYIIITLSTNLLVGVSNLVSLSQAAFYGLGAYFSAFCLITLKLSIIPTFFIICGVNGLIALLLAYPALRLKGDSFVLVTLGLQIIIYSILYNWVSVTGGPYGIRNIPYPNIISSVSINSQISFFIFSSIVVLLLIFILKRLIYSPFGTFLKATRDNEIAVQALGRNPIIFKTWAFILSNAFISLAGFLYATYISYIDPTSFNLDESIFILSAIVIGGSGNIAGPLFGAIFVVLIPELLRFLAIPDSIAANMRQIVYGLMLILLMRFRPAGILGEYSFNEK